LSYRRITTYYRNIIVY